MELSEFDLFYKPRTTIKAQALADFVVEMSVQEGNAMELVHIPSPDAEAKGWKLYLDGSSSQLGCGAGLVLIDLKGIRMEYALKFDFPATNNKVEYEALLIGLKLAREVGANKLTVYTDSQLVAGQVAGDMTVKDPGLAKYLEQVKKLQDLFGELKVEKIPRSENSRADYLSKLDSVMDKSSHRSI